MLFASKVIKELREEVAKLKRMVEDRDLDWVDMRSRCKRLLDRTEKAAKMADTPRQVEPENGDDPATSGPSPHPGTFLTERQKLIQQQILRRRGGL